MTSVWASRAITSAGPRRNVRIRIEGGQIAEVEAGVSAGPADERFTGGTLAPGLVDLQVNGALGAAYSDADPAARRRATEFHLRAGTTSLLATLISAPVEKLVEQLRRLARDVETQPELAGIHLEGPFLNPEKAGAHAPGALCDPTPERLERLSAAGGAALAMFTLAPERPGALDAVERLAERGVVVAAGHTLATYDRMLAAADRGLSFLTHLGNASEWPTRVYDPELGYRRGEPGAVGAFLIDRRLRASLILDGRHLQPELARALIGARGRDAIALVSDATPFAGLGPGTYELWGMRARVHEAGHATCGQGLAGGTLSLSEVLRVAVRQAGLTLAQALHCASRVPARVLGLGDRKGRLAAGCDADLIVLDAELRVRAVYLAGERVPSG